MPYKRQRVEETLRDFFAESIFQWLSYQREGESHYGIVSVTEVILSRDRSAAHVCVRASEHERELLLALRSQEKSFRTKLAQTLSMRSVPEIRFVCASAPSDSETDILVLLDAARTEYDAHSHDISENR